MKKTIEVVFIGLLALLVACPLLSLFGVKETWTDLFGWEDPVEVPVLSMASFRDASYQKSFSEKFAKGFFPRKCLVKLRNEFFERMNFGQFHEGYSRGIMEMSDGALITKEHILIPSLDCSASRISEKRHGEVLDKVAELQRLLTDRGIDFLFVMAPSKDQLYPADLPWVARALLKRRDLRVQDDMIRLLQKRRIKYFDAGAFLRNRYGNADQLCFPYAGAHWNALGACAAWNEALEQLNRSGFGGYAVNPFLGVEPTQGWPFYDEDLGRLLNLFYAEALLKNISYEPIYANPLLIPNEGSLLIWGDSFTDQFVMALRRSHEFRMSDILQCNKRMPSGDEASAVVRNLRTVIFVYTTTHICRLQELFLHDIGNLISVLRERLLAERTVWKSRSADTYVLPTRKCPMSERHLGISLGRGFLSPEPWGVWSGALESHLTVGLPEGSGVLKLGLQPFGNLKWVEIYHGDRCLAKWMVKGETILTLDCDSLPRNAPVDLRFVASSVIRPCDLAPQSPDKRQLAFGLTFLEWSPAESAECPSRKSVGEKHGL